LDAYLTPRDGELPSGENLEYDPGFVSLMQEAKPGEERQVGSTIVPGEEPNYREVIAAAHALLERTHDLRIATVLAHAQTATRGIEGLAEVLGYMRGCLDTWWDSCHPQLDADDDDDPTMRVNAVLGLTDTATVMRALRLSPLGESVALGRVSLRDVMIAEGEIPKPDDMATAPDETTVAAIFRDSPPDRLRARLAAARTALAEIQAIDRIFDTRIPTQGPTLDPLIRGLRKIVARLAQVVGEPEEPAAPGDDAAPAQAGAAQAARPQGGISGEITSSRDVVAAIDRIIAYYDTYEPSSPLPILLRRARMLVGADFLTIVREIAFDGLENVKKLGGLPDDT
jgi:type VI secretion system protein ImpA